MIDMYYRTIVPGSITVEVGAAMGEQSINIGTAVGPTGHHYVFDANPVNIPIIQRNLDANGISK